LSARVHRAVRLVDLGKDRVVAAQNRLAQAIRTLVEARGEVERCEAAWTAAALAPSGAVVRVDHLEQQSAHLRTLRLQGDVARRRVAEALAVEGRCKAALAEAASERRKLERWLERLQASEREQGKRAEARAEDEMAARTVRQRP
jgi:flagellar export protein FliJ